MELMFALLAGAAFANTRHTDDDIGAQICSLIIGISSISLAAITHYHFGPQ